MKKLAMVLITVFLVFGMAGTSSAYTWATNVQWWEGTGVATGRDITDNALGAPDKDPVVSGGVNFLSLGLDGYAVFDFGTEFSDASVIFETTYGNRTGYLEGVRVYAVGTSYNWGDNPVDFSGSPAWTQIDDYFTNASETITFNVGGPFRYLALLDITRDIGGVLGDGFDVNAVGVSPVPEPATMVLLGMGLLGLIGVRRKFMK
jgi:hypothetical protein